MARVFISYKRDDKKVVFPLKDKIEAAIGEPCWIDLDGIESDAQFVNVIMQAIDEADVFLFMYSKKHSQIEDYEKDWTVREITYAQDAKKRIVFINIDGTPLTKWFKFMFGLKQQVDASDPKAFNKLLEDLQKWLGIKKVTPPTPPTPPENNKKDKKKIHRAINWIVGCILGFFILCLIVGLASDESSEPYTYPDEEWEYAEAVADTIVEEDLGSADRYAYIDSIWANFNVTHNDELCTEIHTHFIVSNAIDKRIYVILWVYDNNDVMQKSDNTDEQYKYNILTTNKELYAVETVFPQYEHTEWQDHTIYFPNELLQTSGYFIINIYGPDSQELLATSDKIYFTL